MFTISKNDQRGGIYVITLFVMSALMLIGVSLIKLTSTNMQRIASGRNSIKARYLAEAGIEKAIVEHVLTDSDKDMSDLQNKDVYSDYKLGAGTVTVNLSNGQKKAVQITATGLCNGQQKTVSAIVTIHWKKKTAAVTEIKWTFQ